MTDDLDALVRQLNAGSLTEAPAGEGDTARLDGWLRRVVERSASDLLLVAGAPPAVRIDKLVLLLEEAILSGDDVTEAVEPALHAHALRLFREQGVADASYRLQGLGRFRINLHRERGRAAAAIRRLPSGPPRLAALNLPDSVEALTRLDHGLVLVGGPTGSGKTTTIAALVAEINHRDARHIITIEDPIEYEHAHQKSIVEQIEIGIDAPDFNSALRSALRQAPDVIVVGEMRDPETMRMAVAAGETGHLVFSTLHTHDVANSVARITDSFPLERQQTIRQELAMSVAAVLTQRLLPGADGGLVPAAELLMVGYGARQHIRKNAVHHLHQEITITRKYGSFTLEETLAGLVRRGAVKRTDALACTEHVEELDKLLAAP